MTTLGQKIQRLKRRYKKITGHRFAYNNQKETTLKYRRVTVYLLLHAEFGHSLMRITTNHRPLTPVKWWSYLKNHWSVEAWPRIREHLAVGGKEYRLVDIVCFAGEKTHAVQKSNRAGAFKKRRKAKSAGV